jgi:hypothetical protein
MIEPDLTHDTGRVPVRTLRQFGALWLVIFLALAAWQWLMRGHTAAAIALASAGAIVGTLGLLKPEAIRPLFVGLIAVTFPIGWLVSHAMLAVLFYGVFTPIGLFFRLIRRDALRMRAFGEGSTYWQRKRAADLRSYLRQS